MIKDTYFDEGNKAIIAYFLANHLTGHNLDIGGGWYLHYPNSTVLDLSSVCLKNNPAREKVHFEDYSFDSATFISVWQYLQYPEEVLAELLRVIKPGGEVYLINGQNAGCHAYFRNASKTPEIEEFFKAQGYDTLIENIPDAYGNVGYYKSVCVALPDLNGKSTIRNKAKRSAYSNLIFRNPVIFLKEYKEYDLGKIREILETMATYPVTEYSRRYLERVEKFTQHFFRETGAIPLVFIEHRHDLDISLMTGSDDEPTLSFFAFGDSEKSYSLLLEELSKVHGVTVVYNENYFDILEHNKVKSIEDLLVYASWFLSSKNNESDGKHLDDLHSNWDLHYLLGFVKALGLNIYTKSLQSQLFHILDMQQLSNLPEVIFYTEGIVYESMVKQVEQHRSIQDYAAKKRLIEEGDEPIVGYRKLDIERIIDVLRILTDVNLEIL